MATQEQLRSIVARYAVAFGTMDAEAYGALFAPDAVQTDPFGSPPNVGRPAIVAFITRTFEAHASMRFEVDNVHVAADRVAYSFHATVVSPQGVTRHIRGIEVVTAGDDGLIASLEAYWGPEDVTPE